MTIISNISTITVTPTITGQMKIGILEWYGKISWFINADNIVNLYKKWIGSVDVWKIGPRYDELEPNEGQFSTEYIKLIKRILNEAQTNNIKVQIAISGGNWPSWTGADNVIPRYINSSVNQKFANTWKRLANEVKGYSSLGAYLLIVEEVNITNAIMDDYVNANKVVIDSIRSVDSIKNPDGTYKHKIYIRPDITRKPEDTKSQLYISKNGTHEWDFGRGAYPTGPDDSYASNESPLSYTSYMYMSVYLRRNPPLVRDQNKKYGVGEVGLIKGSADTFGDEEKLKGFKRMMAMAYDMGYEEFDIWEDRFRFANPQTYGPRLKQFRDLMITKPRLKKYNVRLIVEDTDGRMGLIKSPDNGSKRYVNVDIEPYYHLIRRLDEEGYSWFHVTNTTEPYPNTYDRTIRTSEIKGKAIVEQDALINSRLAGITKNGSRYSWSTGEVILRP